MGRKDPAYPGCHQRGHLVALTLSFFLTCWPGPTASTTSTQSLTTPGSNTHITPGNSRPTGATESTNISKTSALTSGEQRSPGKINLTSVSGVTPTSLSAIFVPKNTTNHPTMAENETKGTLSASIAPPETSVTERRNSWDITSNTSDLSTVSQEESSTVVSPSHTPGEIRSPDTTANGYSPSTTAPGSSAISRTLDSSTPSEEMWTSAGTSEPSAEPQSTWGAETSPTEETLATETGPIHTSLAQWIVSESTEPSTSFTETASPGETSSDTPTLEATAGPTPEETTPSTEITSTGDSDTSISQDTTPLPTAATAPSGTAVGVTPALASAPVSMWRAVTTLDPGSSAPGGTASISSKTSSKMPGKPDSKEGTSQVLTVSNAEHHFSSPDTSPPGDLMTPTSVPLFLSTSISDPTRSPSSPASDHRVASSKDTEAPGSTERTEPNPAFPLSETSSHTETSGERVRGTTSPLGHPSPPGEGTARSVFTPSTSPDATDSPGISTASTLAWEESSEPGTRSSLQVPREKTTSPSTTAISKETNIHPSLTGNETNETFSGSSAPPEVSAPERERNWMTASAPAPNLSTADSRETSTTRVSPSPPGRELRSPHTIPERHIPSTAPPESSDFLRTPVSSTSTEASRGSAGTGQHLPGSQLTRRTETSPGTKILTSETGPVTISPVTWGAVGSTTPRSSSTETASPKETSSDTPIPEATTRQTTKEFTSPTEISQIGDRDTRTSQDTTYLTSRDIASSETTTHLTLATSNVPVSMATTVPTVAPGSSAPAGTSPTTSKVSSKMPEMLSTGKQDSREGTSQVLTPSNPGHQYWTSNPGHQPSPNSTPAGDSRIPTSPPLLLSTSAPDDTTSRIGAASDHTVVSSMHTETTAKTEPSSAFPIFQTPTDAETGAQRVRGTTFPLGLPSPSGEGTARTVLVPSTSPDAKDSSPITTASTLVSEVSAGLATLGITQVLEVKTTSPSTTSVSEETSTHPSMTEKHTREPLTAPVASSVTSAPGRENNSATTSAPSPGFSSTDSKGTSSIQLSKPHPEWELRTPHTTSERHSPSTTAPGSSAISRTLDSSTPSEEMWTSAGTSEPSTEPQSTWGAETSPTEETLATETGPIHTSLAQWMVSESTEPSTSFAETASPGETSSDTPTLEATAGPTPEETTPSTEITRTGDSDTRTSQDMTSPTSRDTASSETITHLTPAISSAPVSVATAVITVAPGSSAPAGTSPTSSKLSSTVPEVLSTANPDSGKPSSWGLTPSTSRHHFLSSESSPAGNIMKSTSPPLLMSTSILDGTASGLGTFSDLKFTSSAHTETPETTAKTEPSSASPLSSTLSNAETSTERVRGSVATTTTDLEEPGGTTQPMGSFTSLKTISLGTGSPEDSCWSLSTATGEDRTPGMTAVDITTSVAKDEPPKVPISGIAETTLTKESSSGAEFRSAPVLDNSTPFTRPDESVATITREPSQGERGGATRPTSNPASLMTTISVGMSTRSPEMATALKIISSQEPSISAETRYPLENSQKTSTAAVPMVTTVEPGTLQSVATGSGRISLPPSPPGFMTAAKSPAREATTEWVSPSPSEDWTNTHLGTPEGTKKTPGTVSEMTTVMSKGHEDMSWTSPASMGETSSPSSLEPIFATNSPSAPFMLQGNSTFSPVPTTSVLTSDLRKTTEVLGTSLEPVTSTPESVTNISQEILTSSEATSDTETTHSSRITAVTDMGITSSANTEPPEATSAMVFSSTRRDTSVSTSTPDSSKTAQIETEPTSSLTAGPRDTSTHQEESLSRDPSKNTAVTNMRTTNDEHESRSFVSTDSEPSKTVFPMNTAITIGKTTVSTPMSSFSETPRIEAETSSSLMFEMRETSTSKETSSSTDKTTILPDMNTGSVTEVARTEDISSGGVLSASPAISTMSPVISTETITRLSTFPTMTESTEITVTIEQGHPAATSQRTLDWDTPTTTSMVGTNTAVTQGLLHTALMTPMSTGAQEMSWTSPASVEETSSPPSPVTLSAVTSPSPESPTLPGRSPSSPTPVTSLLTHGLVKATDTLGTGLGPVTSSPSTEISSTTELLSTSGASTSTEVLQPSKSTARTHGVNTSSGPEVHSSIPADSEPSSVSSPVVTLSTSRETTVSTSVTHLTETTMIETDSTSSQSPELRETSAIPQNSSTTEKITLLSKVPTDTTAELSKTQPISSTSMSSPGPTQSTMSPDTPAGIITSLSTSPVTTESAELVITSQTGPSEVTSQGTLTLNTVTEASGAGTHPAVTQSFTHSEMSTLMSRGPQDVPSTSPASVEETSSPPSPVTLSAMTSPSPESPTLPGRSPSSPPPVTSLLTHGLVKTTDTLGTGLGSVTSLPSIEISSTTELLSTSGVSTSTEVIQPSKNIARTHGANTSSGPEAHSSTPADSEPSNVTSQTVTPTISRENPVSTPVPHSTETTMIETASTSSLSPELRETSAIPQNSSTTEKITLLSKVPTDTTAELSKTQPISSTSMSSPGPTQSTVSPDTPAGIITSLSTSPVTTESAELVITSQTGPSEVTSQGTLTLNTATEASGAGTHPAVTQSFTHSEMSTLMSRGPQDVSWTSPASVEETSSPPSPVTLSAVTSPSPESPTLPGRSPSSPTPVTSRFTHGLVKTTDTLGTGLGPVTSLPSIEISSTTELLSTSGASTSTEVLQPSKSTTRTHGVHTSSGPEVHSSTPADSEPSSVSSPIVPFSTSRETAVATPMPHSTETMTVETASTSSQSPELRETSTIQQNSSTTEEITLLSKVPTDTTTELSKTQPISSSSTFIPSPTQSAVSPDTPAGIITSLPTSPMTTESAEMTITSQTGLPEATSQGTLTLDTSTSSPSASVHSSAMTSPSLQFPIVPGTSPSSPTPATSLLTSSLMNTTEKLDTIFKPVTTSPSPLSSPIMETLSTSEFSTDTVKIPPSIHTTVTTEGSSNSGHELSSSGSNFSESSRITYPASSTDGITLSTSKPSSFETTAFETNKLSHLTPGLKETSMTLHFSSSSLTNTPPSALSTYGLKSPKMDVTSSVTSSAPVQSLSTQDTDVPVKTVTHFNASPSVNGSAGITLPESSLSMPVSANTHHLHTDTLSSAETTLANTLTSPVSAAMASFATSGVPGAISATSSDGPFSRTESDPKGDTRSTTADGLPSSASTPFPSSTLHTTDPSVSSLSHWITSSPATPSTVDTNLDTESRRTSELPLVTTSTLQAWSQPYWTSLPPIMDTKMTGSVGLGRVTSSSQVIPHSTQSTSKDPQLLQSHYLGLGFFPER
ncbi:mucin-16-like isoform X1 [Ovis aries]|uniref:mucin-16-like isoform X1 n=1 Tax=Ovis aries TaxID=9940 RepID=UPI0029526640|nr:mucin-16-like isoform X1 [Ovis aries]